jgi:hypothetical protein
MGRFLALPLAAAVCWITLGVGTAQGGMVTTQEVVAQGEVANDRAQVKAFLARSDVQQQLRSLGVSPAEATERVAALSDSEVQRIAGELEERPAGALVGDVISAAVTIFVILLITDILGLTDAFHFA